MAADSAIDHVALEAAIALVCMLQYDPEEAKAALLRIPRSRRGDVNIALDDLMMILSRLGNEHG